MVVFSRFFKEKEILNTLNTTYLNNTTSNGENFQAWKEELRNILHSRVLDNKTIEEDFRYLREHRLLNPGFLIDVLTYVDHKAVRYIQQQRWHRRSQRTFKLYTRVTLSKILFWNSQNSARSWNISSLANIWGFFFFLRGCPWQNQARDRFVKFLGLTIFRINWWLCSHTVLKY